MGSPILDSSNLPKIGANRCARKWVNKTGHKILPVKQSKCLKQRTEHQTNSEK